MCEEEGALASLDDALGAYEVATAARVAAERALEAAVAAEREAALDVDTAADKVDDVLSTL